MGIFQKIKQMFNEEKAIEEVAHGLIDYEEAKIDTQNSRQRNYNNFFLKTNVERRLENSNMIDGNDK